MKEGHDSLVELVDQCTLELAKASNVGSYLVDVFHARKSTQEIVRDIRPHVELAVEYVPSWMPGGRWKLHAKKCRKLFDDMVNLPYDAAKADAVSRQAKCL